LRSPVWLWLNLLSLDAPIVALVWQNFLARIYPVALYPAGRCALGLTVWAIYLADRLLDVRDSAPDAETPRHNFYRRYRRFAWMLLATVLCADLLVTFLWLRPAVFANGLLVAAGVIVYLGVFPLGRIRGAWKQPAAAILFTIGVFLVAWTGTASPVQSLGWPAAAFCALCFGNLVIIENWERNRRIKRRAGIWLSLLAVACIAAGHSRWYFAVAASAAGLAALILPGENISRNARRVLADAVLLIPLLIP
jgi:hypothetical protein